MAPTNQQSLKILISGNGIAGQVLLHFLQRSSLPLSLTVIERAPSFRATGQGVDVRNVGVEILQLMGCLSVVRSRVTNEDGWGFYNNAGKEIAFFPAGDGGFSLTSDIEIMRGQLVKAIAEVVDQEKVDYRYGTTIEALSEDDSSVQVTFAGGQKESFDLVIGSDGVYSSVRKILGATKEIAPVSPAQSHDGLYTLHTAVHWCSIPRIPSDDNRAHTVQDIGGHNITIRPASSNTLGVISAVCDASRPDELHRASRMDMDEAKVWFEKEFKNFRSPFTQRVLEGVRETKDLYGQEIAQVHLDRWSSKSGRIILVGDAASATSGLTGLGTTCAIYGAYILAWSIVNEVRATAPPSSVDWQKLASTYESTARPFIGKSQTLVPGTPDIANPQTEWGLKVSRTVMWVVALGIKAFGPAVSKLIEWIPTRWFKVRSEKTKLPDWTD